ncbi:ribose ABC transporter permease [Cetobacterium sp. SF1]|uniref:ribose ABC transporter permease n=1 Tax=unclassified Cetobacterium TaxID=2630983 RepID=UPI003CF62003
MLKKLFNNKPLVGLIGFSIIVSILNPRFLSFMNILNVLRQTSVNSVIAIGMTLVILTGGIDLSVGSILAISGALCAGMMAMGINSVVAIILSLVAGFLFGVLNGVLVSKGKLQPFIVTLVTMTLLRGATLVYTDGKPIPVRDGGFLFENIGEGYLFNIPIPIYIMVLLFVAGYFVLNHTKFGRYIYAIGGNEEATKLSGINTDKIKVLVYGISGILSALAGIIITSRLWSAQPTAGSGYELDAIAAVVLGGTSLAGGVGRITGTALGAIIIGVLGNALNLLDVSSYYQMMIKAIVILAAVLMDRKSKK